MKWFFALNEQSGTYGDYADMIKVAVHTALRYTSLVPYCLYDGQDCALTDWLQGRGVTIIPCRSRFYGGLKALAEARNEARILTFGAGTFLRVEIPKIAAERGFTDEYMLYTDCDIMFLRDVLPDLQSVRPRYFAVAPEADRNNYYAMNVGVMLMNVPALARTDAGLTEFIETFLAELSTPPLGFDQTAYQRYYFPLERGLMRLHVNDRWVRRLGYRLNRVIPYQWDRLPLSLNWKPYWGDIERAALLHFHGPKPQQKDYQNLNLPDAIRGLQSGAYEEMSELWYRHLADANA